MTNTFTIILFNIIIGSLFQCQILFYYWQISKEKKEKSNSKANKSPYWTDD